MLTLVNMDRPCLRQVRLRNYKNLGRCSAALGQLTVLVGRNGAGKSNFLDALAFVTEGLQSSLDQSVRIRGGLEYVLRYSTGHPRIFSIDLEIALPDKTLATYGFAISSKTRKHLFVKTERLVIRDHRNAAIAGFLRQGDEVREPIGERPLPPVSRDRLFLVNAASFPEYRGAYDALLSMGFYNLQPQSMRQPGALGAGELLSSDGSNLASVFHRLSDEQPESANRIQQYLRRIVPDLTGIETRSFDSRIALSFYQRVAGADNSWRFDGNSMSDGTLRALGALIAVLQTRWDGSRLMLVGIEEPETALHPAAAGALMDGLREASRQTQVLVTSHSPDLLDQVNSEEDELLVVASQEGTSQVAPADPASREALRRHLYSAGELLRMDQLQPDKEDLKRQEQIDLFAVPVS